MARFLLAVFLFFLAKASFAQTAKADSLIRLLETIPKDTQYVRYLNLIAEELSDKDASRSLEFAKQGLTFSQRFQFVQGKGVSLNNISWAYY